MTPRSHWQHHILIHIYLYIIRAIDSILWGWERYNATSIRMQVAKIQRGICLHIYLLSTLIITCVKWVCASDSLIFMFLTDRGGTWCGFLLLWLLYLKIWCIMPSETLFWSVLTSAYLSDYRLPIRLPIRDLPLISLINKGLQPANLHRKFLKYLNQPISHQYPSHSDFPHSDIWFEH